MRFSYIERAYIYTLSDPMTNEVRYVGRTRNPESRLLSHLGSIEKTGAKNEWVKVLIELGLKPIFNIIEVCPFYNWSSRENFHIKKYRAIGCNLLNQNALTDWVTTTLDMDFVLRDKIMAHAYHENTSHVKILNKIISEYYSNSNGQELIKVIIEKEILDGFIYSDSNGNHNDIHI